jgi:hypothetical protein
MKNTDNELNGSADSNRLFADQVHKQYENTVFGTAATLINSVILVFILRSHVQHLYLVIWLVCVGMVSAGRLTTHWLYHNSSTQYSHPNKWNRWFLITLFLSGVVWGATAFFLIPSNSIAHQAFIAFVAGGMVAGAVSVFTAVLTNFFAFSIPALLPICGRFFLVGSEVHIETPGRTIAAFSKNGSFRHFGRRRGPRLEQYLKRNCQLP